MRWLFRNASVNTQDLGRRHGVIAGARVSEESMIGFGELDAFRAEECNTIRCIEIALTTNACWSVAGVYLRNPAYPIVGGIGDVEIRTAVGGKGLRQRHRKDFSTLRKLLRKQARIAPRGNPVLSASRCILSAAPQRRVRLLILL